MTDYQAAIAAGSLAQRGLLSAQQITAAAELLAGVCNAGVETVRVVFADQHGILRGKTLVVSALESVFTNGLAAPSTLLLKDTAHKTVFPVWSADPGLEGGMSGAGDLLLVPDPVSYRVLPWTDHSAWILCEPRFKNGDPIPFAPRRVLQTAIDKLTGAGYSMVTGLEVEFHVLDILDAKLDHASSTMPGQPVVTQNLAQGYQFLTETRYDRMEPIANELRRHCQALDLPIRSMEIEMGPGQLEFTFDPADPMTHADNMIMFRTMVKEVCARKGLHATFMCKPKLENSAASGWHLHQSILDSDSGSNLMMPPATDQLSTTASAWIAGLLQHASACCVLTTPTVNGYKRYAPHQLAPDRIQWGRDNRGAMIRALMAPNDATSRIENRVAEPAANPYYYFASQIISGLDGITRGLRAPPAVEAPYDSTAETLPDSLLSAVQSFENSALLRSELGDVFVDYLSHIRRSEWQRYQATISEWEQAEYFDLF